MNRALLCLAPLVMILPSLAGQELPKAWTPDQMMRVKRITEVRPSPEGRRAMFTVVEPVMTAEKSEFLTQVHLAEAGATRQLTFAEKSSTHPRWSPDGTRVAFLSARQGKAQIYVLNLAGGEAEPVTEGKADISALAWSPDGRSLAFTMPDPKSEDEEKAAKGKDDAYWHEEHIAFNRLYVVPLAKNAQGQREVRRLTAFDRHVGHFDWSPDGTRIAFDHTAGPKADLWTTSDVSVVDVSQGTVKPLAATAAAESQPLWSRDGKWIALTVSDAPPRWAAHHRIHLLPVEDGAARILPETPDGQPNLLGWSGDGRHLLFNEARGTLTGLYALATDTGVFLRLDTGADLAAAPSLDPRGLFLGFTLQNPDKALEAYLSPVSGFHPQKLSAVNADLPGLPLGRTEVVRWKGADGLEIEGVLTYPAGYVKGRKVPLLLNVHGGPTGVFQQIFSATPGLYPLAAFAAKGFAVLRPNPRGSSGYGKDFRFANLADWGGKDFKDLMAGVDKVIEMGVADPDRLGVMGWSYGGFMTSWTITQTKRFKAASVGAGVTNLMSFDGVTDIPAFVPDYFGGQSWEKLDGYMGHSALFQVKGVSTPTLIQHCQGDLRVPISQGYEFYNALKQQGTPVRMLVVPRQAHGPTEPKAMLKIMETNLAWFEEKLGKGTSQQP